MIGTLKSLGLENSWSLLLKPNSYIWLALDLFLLGSSWTLFLPLNPLLHSYSFSCFLPQFLIPHWLKTFTCLSHSEKQDLTIWKWKLIIRKIWYKIQKRSVAIKIANLRFYLWSSTWVRADRTSKRKEATGGPLCGLLWTPFPIPSMSDARKNIIQVGPILVTLLWYKNLSSVRPTLEKGYNFTFQLLWFDHLCQISYKVRKRWSTHMGRGREWTWLPESLRF